MYRTPNPKEKKTSVLALKLVKRLFAKPKLNLTKYQLQFVKLLKGE